MKTSIKFFVLALCAMTNLPSFGQEFDINLQLRPRLEYRNGFKELMKDQAYPTSFVSQRSRMNFSFGYEKIKTHISFQNVRVWGDVATTTATDQNGIALHESWASYDFHPKWKAKLGRQTLIYDNQRIFGGIDWAQQGQSHDAFLLIHKTDSYQLDFGAALNNTNEALYETAYFTNYKNMQFAWFHKNFTDWSLSVLALNNGFQYENLTDNTFQVAYIQTFGTYTKWKKSKWYGDAGLYAQTGEMAVVNDKADVAAWYVGICSGYTFSPDFKAEIGFEYLSGKDQNDSNSKITSFNPLFGTNHQFNGFMDYFYVGNHKNSVGLQDLYAKFSYEKNKWQFTLSPHLFYSAAQVIDPITSSEKDNYLGTEIDLTAAYKADKNLTITGGYSQMFAGSTMELLKGGNGDYTNNWAWIMVSFHPKIFSHKTN